MGEIESRFGRHTIPTKVKKAAWEVNNIKRNYIQWRFQGRNSIKWRNRFTPTFRLSRMLASIYSRYESINVPEHRAHRMSSSHTSAAHLGCRLSCLLWADQQAASSSLRVEKPCVLYNQWYSLPICDGAADKVELSSLSYACNNAAVRCARCCTYQIERAESHRRQTGQCNVSSVCF